MKITVDFLKALTAGHLPEEEINQKKPISYEDLRTIIGFVYQQYGELLDNVLPELRHLVSMVDPDACLPVLSFLQNAINRVDSSKDLQTCDILYPDVKTSQALHYLPECRTIGLSEVDIATTRGLRGLPRTMMTRGFIIEVFNYLGKYFYCDSKQAIHEKFYWVLKYLFQLNHLTDCQQHTLYMRASRDNNSLKKFKKNKKQEQVNRFVHELFEVDGGLQAECLPQMTSVNVGSDELVERLKSLNLEVGKVSIPENLRGVVDSLTTAFSLSQKNIESLQHQKNQLAEKAAKLRKEKFDALRQHREEIADKQRRLDEKAAQLKVSRRSRDHFKEQAMKIREDVNLLINNEQELTDAKKTNADLKGRIQQLEREKKCLKEQVRYHKSSALINSEDCDLYSRKVAQLTDEVNYWQSQYVECKDQIEEFLGQKDIVTFQDGRYTDTVREVYMELMCMRVGAKNVQKIIRTVLEKMTGFSAQRLPGETFAKYMLLEARSVAISHLKDEIHSSANNLTIGPDGTTKFGHHYGAISVSLTGKTMVMGLRDMACGDAEAYQKLVEDIIGEISNDDRDEIRQIAAKIKNTVSDQASVNKKFVTLLTEWRDKALPHVVDNWDTLTTAEKNRYSSINYFFCGLHFLVGLSEQANKTLLLWENLIHSGMKVGCLTVPGGYCKTGESGTTRLVRTVCKAIQDRGCEKSGKPVEFRDYLQRDGLVKDVPLASFKGNRFNILFHNAAGCYYLLHDLQSFADEHKGDNKLFAAINADLDVAGFQAGIRALGIISKMVTGPIWRFLEKKGHVSELSPVYQHLCDTFKKWAKDASKMMKGEDFLFTKEDVQQDDVYAMLVTPQQELDPLTCQILELLFCSFQLVCERQLKDHLAGGKYGTNWSADLLSDSSTVPRTNIGPERIFAELDNLIRIMPRATTNAIEGITMWTQNHTSDWLGKLEPLVREDVMRKARQNAKEQRQLYIERMAAIREKRHAALVNKRERAAVKEHRERQRKEELTCKIQEYGGLWTSAREVDKRLKSLPIGDKLKALQAQIMFRRYVLGDQKTGKLLNKMAAGKYLNAEMLTANLKCVIQRHADSVQEIQVQPPRLCNSQLLSSLSLQEEKDKFQKLVDEEKSKRSVTPKRQKTASGMSSSDVPELADPEDLVGKRVQHLFKDKKGKQSWYYGVVTGLKVRSGKFLYSIVYDGDDDQSYSYPLLDDYASRQLRIVPIDPQFIVGYRIDHRFQREEDGEYIWYTGRVTGYDGDTQLYTVVYDYESTDDLSDDEEEDDSEPGNVFDEPLLSDYLNGDVRILLD